MVSARSWSKSTVHGFVCLFVYGLSHLVYVLLYVHNVLLFQTDIKALLGGVFIMVKVLRAKFGYVDRYNSSF